MSTPNRLRDVFFFLLRQGLWGKTEETIGLFPISVDEWHTIYTWACKHVVHGIIYDGMLLLPSSYYPPKSLLIQWITNIDQRERKTKAQIQMLVSLKKFFNEEPVIPFELIKGLAIGCYYPHPLHRFSGDLDFYFGGAEQVEKANKRLESAGVPVKRGCQNDSFFNLNHLVIENHPTLIELHNPFLKKKLRNWEKKVFGQGNPAEFPLYLGTPINVPIPIAHHLLVSTHILKHLLDEGIGLRQLCDAAILLKALHQQTDAAELEKQCRIFGIFRWSQALYALLVKYLGVSKEFLPFPTHVNPDILMEEIWESGDFGIYDNRKVTRPKGKWKNKLYTIKQITRKASLVFRYAPAETFWWPTTLAAIRIKELFTSHEKADRKDTL